MPDKYTATWVSHSSISDFLACPRAYYLNNVYKDSKTGHKISLINPSLALGQIVHEVVESLSVLPTDKRFQKPLVTKYNKLWDKVSGKKGGFTSDEQERTFKKRGEKMLQRVLNNPGPIERLAVKINQDLPHYWLSEADNIILCGKIDWLEYLPNDSVHIIDFKTSKREVNSDSLQLPIYHLLVHNCQNHKVSQVSYWYLELHDEPTEQKLPDLRTSHDQVLKIAKDIKLARSLERFKCPRGESSCRTCKPLEAIIAGNAELIGTNDFNQDVYVVDTKPNSKISNIL